MNAQEPKQPPTTEDALHAARYHLRLARSLSTDAMARDACDNGLAESDTGDASKTETERA